MQIDQATTLRNLAKNVALSGQSTCPQERTKATTAMADREIQPQPPLVRTIAISSGKGGVGKTSLTVNLAIALSRLGQKMLILDGDLGLANVDILLGLHAKYNLHHLVKGTKKLDDLVINGPEGIKIIPGGSGLYQMANLSDYQAQTLVKSIATLDGTADFLLIDTAAGISANVVNLVRGTSEVIVVACPEPTSVTDAYGLIKTLSLECRRITIKLIINMAQNWAEAEDARRRIASAAKHFLGTEIEHVGSVPFDVNVARAVQQQIPFVVATPRSPASAAISEIGHKLLNDPKRNARQNFTAFLHKRLNCL